MVLEVSPDPLRGLVHRHIHREELHPVTDQVSGLAQTRQKFLAVGTPGRPEFDQDRLLPQATGPGSPASRRDR